MQNNLNEKTIRINLTACQLKTNPDSDSFEMSSLWSFIHVFLKVEINIHFCDVEWF